MTTRTTKLGTTDWTDGEVLYAADLNSTSNELASQKMELITGMGVTNPILYDAGITRDTVSYDGTSAGDTLTNVFIDTPNTGHSNLIYGIQAYDLCNNEAVDAGLWTEVEGGGGAAVENTEEIYITASGTDTASLTTNDLSDGEAADFTIMCRGEHYGNKDSGASNTTQTYINLVGVSSGSVQLTDTVYTGGNPDTNGYLLEVRWDKNADTVDVYIDGSLATADIDVSSLVGGIALQAVANVADIDTGTPTATIRLTGVFSSVVSGTPTLVSSTKSLTETTTNGSLFVSAITLNSGTITPSISGNGGSNYDSGTLSDGYLRSKISTTGTSGRLKFVYAISEGDGIPNHADFGAFYNN